MSKKRMRAAVLKKMILKTLPGCLVTTEEVHHSTKMVLYSP